MNTSDKKESELQRTLARLRGTNPQEASAVDVKAEEQKKGSQTKRQRVSPTQLKVGTLDRQSVLHAAMRDILLGQITQGEALKKLRVDVLGLKQDEYASLVNVSRKTLSDVENGKGNYSVEVVNKIFKPFGLETGLVPISKTLIAKLLS